MRAEVGVGSTLERHVLIGIDVIHGNLPWQYEDRVDEPDPRGPKGSDGSQSTLSAGRRNSMDRPSTMGYDTCDPVAQLAEQLTFNQ